VADPPSFFILSIPFFPPLRNKRWRNRTALPSFFFSRGGLFFFTPPLAGGRSGDVSFFFLSFPLLPGVTAGIIFLLMSSRTSLRTLPFLFPFCPLSGRDDFFFLPPRRRLVRGGGRRAPFFFFLFPFLKGKASSSFFSKWSG